jgi:molybdate transport system permease protein
MTSSRSWRHPPRVVMGIATLAALTFAIPIGALLWRVPWGDLGSILGREHVRDAVVLSVLTSCLAALLSATLGIPLAWTLARVSFPGRAALRALCTMSMVLPPVVGGVALLAAFGRRGVVGRHLDTWFGLRLPFSTPGVVLAQVFVAMPFLIVTVEAALRQVDERVEDASRTLGASSWYAFTRITLPTIRPALVAGTALAWARALGEFGATITFAGNLPGKTQTLPLATYLALDSADQGEALALGLVLMTTCFLVLVALRDQWTGTRVAPASVKPR